MLRARPVARLRAAAGIGRAPSNRCALTKRGLADTQPTGGPTPKTSDRPGVAQPNPLLSPTLHRYAPRLYALSASTGVPLSSLALSFLVLHELTAIVPLVLLFWLFQVLGAGAAFVHWIKGVSDPSTDTGTAGAADGGWSWRRTIGGWMEEGEKRVERVGRRYGILGYEKASRDHRPSAGTGDAVNQERGLTRSGAGAAGGVTNAIAAYVVVKALLPVRIGVSIAGAPAFARFALEPFRRLGLRLGSRRKPVS